MGWTEAAFRSSGVVGVFCRRSVTPVVTVPAAETVRRVAEVGRYTARWLACAGECPRLARGMVTFFAKDGRDAGSERETPTGKPWASGGWWRAGE